MYLFLLIQTDREVIWTALRPCDVPFLQGDFALWGIHAIPEWEWCRRAK